MDKTFKASKDLPETSALSINPGVAYIEFQMTVSLP
jgi:hypothetical protein